MSRIQIQGGLKPLPTLFIVPVILHFVVIGRFATTLSEMSSAVIGTTERSVTDERGIQPRLHLCCLVEVAPD